MPSRTSLVLHSLRCLFIGTRPSLLPAQSNTTSLHRTLNGFVLFLPYQTVMPHDGAKTKAYSLRTASPSRRRAEGSERRSAQSAGAALDGRRPRVRIDGDRFYRR